LDGNLVSSAAARLQMPIICDLLNCELSDARSATSSRCRYAAPIIGNCIRWQDHGIEALQHAQTLWAAGHAYSPPSFALSHTPNPKKKLTKTYAEQSPSIRHHELANPQIRSLDAFLKK
jgi:hypothetical protein